MMIVCPNCQTSYDVAANSLGGAGRSVRCVRCREVWFAAPEPAGADGGAPVSAAAASAQYQKGAGARQGEPHDGSPRDDRPPDDDASVDANLAARAAGRLSGELEDTAPVEIASEEEHLPPAAYDAPPLAPEAGEHTAETVEAVAGDPPIPAEPSHDIESVAARRARHARPRSRRGLRPSLPMLIMLMFAVNVALIGWRSDVVRIMPQTASLYAAIGLPVNLRGLAFTELVTTKEVQDGVAVLLVQGTIVNLSRQPLDVPRVRLALRNAAGAEVYSWTMPPSRAVLAPGDAQPFQTRLASPPTEGREVVVRFFTRRDAAGGAH